MLLENRNALVYGAGGPIGGAVARAFAREGAVVYLAGRTRSKLEALVDEICAAGGRAEAAEVDTLDERAVDAYVDDVDARAGSIAISFNLIEYGDVQQPLAEISVDDFLRPIVNAMRSHFLTTRAAARHMVKQGSGVILAFGGSDPHTFPGVGGYQVALDAIEGHRRQWASELGEHGVRVVTLKTGGIPEIAPGVVVEEIAGPIADATLLKRAATLADVGNVAAFVASDLARTITSTAVNISCGSLPD